MLKAMKRFLLASVFAVTVVVNVGTHDGAKAAPVSIGSAVGLALFSAGVPVAGFTATTALVIGNVIVGAATIGAQLLLGQQSNAPVADPGQFKSTFENPEGPEIRAVGRVRLGGLFFFRNTSKELTFRAIAQCRGPTDAIEDYLIGGRDVVVDQTDWTVQSPPWENGDASSAYLIIKNKVGDGTETAWPELIAAFPELWTSDHRARGISQILAQFRSPGISSPTYLSLYGAPGVREQIETVIRAELIYDPREASHDLTDALTWDWSDNGILCAVHMLRTFPSVVDSDIDWSDVADEADKADALVATKAGTERRSRAWGAWGSEGKNRGEVMEAMLDSIGAEITESDEGLIRIRLVDDIRTSELTYTTKHITSVRLKYGPESVERPNICRVKYYSPERNYELTELPLVADDGETPLAWSRYQNEIDRVGEQPFDLELPFCPCPSQAQRIARRRFLFERADKGIAVANMAGIAAWGLRVVDIPFPEIGENGADLVQKCLIGTPRVDDEDAVVEIPFVVQPEIATWAPATDEAAPLPDVPPIEFESDIPKPAAPTGTALVQYADNSYELRMLWVFTSGASRAEGSYRTFKNNDTYLPDPWNPVSITGSQLGAVSVGDILGDTVAVRVRMLGPTNDNVSYLSDVVTIENIAIDNTVPSAPAIVGTLETDGATYDIDFTITFPIEISPVRLVVTRQFEGGLETTVLDEEGRGGDVKTVTETFSDSGDDLTYRATFYTSDSTASTTTEQTVASAAV